MVTTITLIMWVFLSNGSQTYSTEDADTLADCLVGEQRYLLSKHALDPAGSTFAAACVVHQQIVS